MRKIQARRAIVDVLIAHPNGLTGQEIITKLDPKVSRNSISDTRHISNLMRGAKGVTRIKNGGVGVMLTDGITVHKYKVLLYKVTDESELIRWIGGKVR